MYVRCLSLLNNTSSWYTLLIFWGMVEQWAKQVLENKFIVLYSVFWLGNEVQWNRLIENVIFCQELWNLRNWVSLNVINFIRLHARSTPLAICKFAKCMQISTWSANFESVFKCHLFWQSVVVPALHPHPWVFFRLLGACKFLHVVPISNLSFFCWFFLFYLTLLYNSFRFHVW